MVLVAGATGQTGRRVVARLLARGVPVRVLSRSAERARQMFGASVEVVEGDIRVPQSLGALGRDLRAAIVTVGTRTYYGANGGWAVDGEGVGHLVGALAREGTPHVVLQSAFGLDRQSFWLRCFSIVLGDYFRHKAAAEAAVRASGLPYTIVRPVELRNRAARSGPLLNQHEPLSLLRTVSRELVADVLVACTVLPQALSRTVELCEGSEVPLEEQLLRAAVDAERKMPQRTPLY
jgi:uncharacterized protein YbjT (DUF2867 family)